MWGQTIVIILAVLGVNTFIWKDLKDDIRELRSLLVDHLVEGHKK